MSADPRAALSRASGIPLARLTDDCPLAELAPDSFAMVEVLLALQDECGVTVRSRDLEDARTVGDLLRACTADRSVCG